MKCLENCKVAQIGFKIETKYLAFANCGRLWMWVVSNQFASKKLWIHSKGNVHIRLKLCCPAHSRGTFAFANFGFRTIRWKLWWNIIFPPYLIWDCWTCLPPSSDELGMTSKKYVLTKRLTKTFNCFQHLNLVTSSLILKNCEYLFLIFESVR